MSTWVNWFFDYIQDLVVHHDQQCGCDIDTSFCPCQGLCACKPDRCPCVWGCQYDKTPGPD